MSVIININDPDDKDTIEIPLDGIYFNDSSVKGSPDQHVDSPISMVEVSPNGNYLVYYREKDKKIVVRDVNHDLELNKANKLQVEEELNKANKLEVDEELNKAIKLQVEEELNKAINLQVEEELNKANEAESDTGKSYKPNEYGKISHMCQKIYRIPNEADVISISKDNKIWLRFNDNIYVWEMFTGHTTIVLKNINEAKDIKILDDEENEYTLLKSNNEITVYSNKLRCPITLNEKNEEKEGK
ncbi:hypothetical protein RhiirA4_496375 [Rhizophagus irregularis]|uniref:Uncharacterized protein n=1 Tax=Rhizophagus irregularis TaxID=588596 RepID=A0A2I1H0L3_9GLOM|nr:hypothetical protein RhiirA4_532145 [Rhizophagus irregularis]PKY52361.1 hypothetical protein RhiirA4_496375 [Rhizophagus irregularis]